MSAAFAWADVERITQGQLGRTVSTLCPFCSHTRRTINQRKRVFAVRLKEPDFAIYNCAHCCESGYVHPETARVIDPVERRRRQAEADRREREDKQRRTASALTQWNERQPFRGSPAETYLRITRGIGDWLDAFDLDESLGFHSSCPFGNERLPCIGRPSPQHRDRRTASGPPDGAYPVAVWAAPGTPGPAITWPGRGRGYQAQPRR
jgi:hypothetical protein